MTFARTELLDALDTVISIPLIPFAAGRIDYEGQRRNVDYLMRNNHLSGGRPRVIALAGTSLINHIRPQEQLRLLDVTGQQMGGEGLLMAALVPNPLAVAGDLIDELAQLSRPPDIYLLMPLAGTFSPEGLYQQLLAFTACYGERHGARFLYYYRSPRDREQISASAARLAARGGRQDRHGRGGCADLCRGCRCGTHCHLGRGRSFNGGGRTWCAQGHTSGINIVFARASDAINNAQRSGDFHAAREVEALIDPLEQLRFVNGRAWNYAAVAEAIRLGDFGDVVAGCGAPFNPRVPAEVSAQIGQIVADLRAWH